MARGWFITRDQIRSECWFRKNEVDHKIRRYLPFSACVNQKGDSGARQLIWHVFSRLPNIENVRRGVKWFYILKHFSYQNHLISLLSFLYSYSNSVDVLLLTHGRSEIMLHQLPICHLRAGGHAVLLNHARRASDWLSAKTERPSTVSVLQHHAARSRNIRGWKCADGQTGQTDGHTHTQADRHPAARSARLPDHL